MPRHYTISNEKCGKCDCVKGLYCKNRLLIAKESEQYHNICGNIKMNKIFIDVCRSFAKIIFSYTYENMVKDKYTNYVYSDLELKQIEDNIIDPINMLHYQCKVISEKIKTYWGSSGFGTHALNFEKIFNDLQQAKQQIQTLENETDIKTKEIAKLIYNAPFIQRQK